MRDERERERGGGGGEGGERGREGEQRDTIYAPAFPHFLHHFWTSLSSVRFFVKFFNNFSDCFSVENSKLFDGTELPEPLCKLCHC